MDSYLSNIDTYMQQQQQQEQLLKRQREQQQLMLQQQQRQQQQQQPPLTEEWLRNMSNLSVGPTANPESMFPNPTLYMSNPNAYNSHTSSSTNTMSNYAIPQASYIQPPEPGYDINGQPIRIRKKPGRKPNPASPALRKAQNRAAQRAFRERKERHLKDLETTIRNLREQRNNATRELNSLKGNLESYKAENWYLKGVVLTLQFVCMHHNIQIPTHSPYLAEDALANIAQTAPHAIEAYVNAYTRNNTNLKSTMSYHFATSGHEQEQKQRHEERERDRQANYESMEYGGEDDYDTTTVSSPPTQQPSVVKNEEEDSQLNWMNQLNESNVTPPPPLSKSSNKEQHPPTSSMDAIQHIRLKLGVQSILNDTEDGASARLKPTILQLAIPHDPRIDLVPTPHMRDRMIIFRDQMDYDRCFTMMLNGAVYHGGDPTMSESWELPPEFFSEFWYLSIDYDIKKTNNWRRLKGLADVEPGPRLQDWSINTTQQQQQQQWDDGVFDQIVKGMPSLQPLEQQQKRYPLSPPRPLDMDSPTSSKGSPKQLYTRLMTAPQLRPPVQSPSLENMIDMMNQSVEDECT